MIINIIDKKESNLAVSHIQFYLTVSGGCKLREYLGNKGTHARTAFSVTQLPLNSPVELCVTFATLPCAEGQVGLP